MSEASIKDLFKLHHYHFMSHLAAFPSLLHAESNPSVLHDPLSQWTVDAEPWAH